jgi:hypothetical protein
MPCEKQVNASNNAEGEIIMKTSICQTKTITALVTIVAILALGACGTQSFVKPVQITKDTAETVLYQARIMQNKGTLTAIQFDQVRKAYDALKIAQDVVIDARVAYLASESTTNKAALDAALTAVTKELTNLTKVAVDLGVITGGK